MGRAGAEPGGRANGTAATATPLGGTGAVFEGNVFPAADVDFYAFTAAAGDRIYAATSAPSSASGSKASVLDLLAPDGVTVLESEDDDSASPVSSASIAGFPIPSPGTYFLRIRHQLATGQVRPYRLFFQQRAGAPEAETEPNDTFPPGQALPAGGWVAGLTSADGPDTFAFDLAAGDTVFLSLDLDPERDGVEWDGSLALGLFGGGFLAADDGGAGTPDSEAFVQTVQTAGTYGISVSGTTFGTYHLSATVFPAADEGIDCATFTSAGGPVAIPAGPGTVTSTLTVPGNPRIADLDVEIDLLHSRLADLDVQLTAPAGNTVGIFSDIGSTLAGSPLAIDAAFDDEGAASGGFAAVENVRVTTEPDYRLAWFDGQPAGGTWTLTVRDDAAGEGGTLNGWSIRVCQPVPPPACAPGFVPATVYSTDFDFDDDGGFTHSGTADEWEQGTPDSAPLTGCNSGTSCWKTDLDGTYEPDSSQDLLSPVIDLANLAAPVVVRWAQKYQMGNASADRLLIEARAAGDPSRAVRLFDWLGASMTDTVGSPEVTVQEAAGWGLMSARADALAGLATELRFHLDSGGGSPLAGLAVDDVSVTACRPLTTDLVIFKTDRSATAVPGDTITYSIVVGNPPFGGDSTTAVVTDTFPPALTCTWTCSATNRSTCTAAGAGDISDTVFLPSPSTLVYIVTCAVDAAATGILTNTATVEGPFPDPDPSGNSSTDVDVLTPRAALAVSKTNGTATVNAGGRVTYTIAVSNEGPSNVPGATVTDDFPASLTCTWICQTARGATCTAAGSGDISDTVDLPARSHVVYTALCNLSRAASGTLSNTASVSVPAGVIDDLSNNSATDNDTIQGAPDAAVSGRKTASGTFAAGGTVVYTITLDNPGGAQADNPGHEFTDALAPQLTLISASATSGTATANHFLNTVTWNGAIPAGGSVTLTVTAVILQSAGGATVSNQGAIAFDANGDGTNESTAQTDDPALPGAADATSFQVAPEFLVEIPALAPAGLLVLATALAALSLALLRRL
ncbi:MAG TPA: proprotein convertase P-domain-containing protein [Thermoanaerobaculia bacterium]|nr:proprotein convertase P-domain-containing protein [Thermoanaerobaculia bacterium]